jgi:hypothetical protein
MRSSDLLPLAALLFAAPASAAPPAAPGFALERLYQSAPGAGWIVMDSLDMHGTLGGVAALTSGYARNPLEVGRGTEALRVVSDQAFADFGFALTYDRLRFSLNLDAPVVVTGDSGVAGGYSWSDPSVNPGDTPDVLADPRIGLDVRVVGGPRDPFRLGLGGQLYFPTGPQNQYLSDGVYRGMLRVLFAGDLGTFTYAGQLGVHVRTLDEPSVPGAPRGSELLFGVAAGSRVGLDRARDHVLVFGPEIFGETAFRSFFDGAATGLEGLLSARVEGTKTDSAQLRFKLGVGSGFATQFGSPDFRVVAGIELFNRASDRDRDDVRDTEDACPENPGVPTDDPKTNGCRRIPPLVDPP